MNSTTTMKGHWSKEWYNDLLFATWNCFSYSNERHQYCQGLGFDILALTELHGRQLEVEQSKRWVVSAKGCSSDPASGVGILLSARMARKMASSGSIGSRIVWVRVITPVCPIFFVCVYIPHKHRRQAPYATDVLAQLDELLATVAPGDCVIIAGDLNCQLQRNVPGCTGQWAMTTRSEKQGHDNLVLDLMRAYDLFAIDTLFRPKGKMWGNKRRVCNATYMPKDVDRRPTRLDYFLVSNRRKAMAVSSEVKWAPSLHRFGGPDKFDHGMVKVRWRCRLRASRVTPRRDYESMGVKE